MVWKRAIGPFPNTSQRLLQLIMVLWQLDNDPKTCLLWWLSALRSVDGKLGLVFSGPLVGVLVQFRQAALSHCSLAYLTSIALVGHARMAPLPAYTRILSK